MDEGERIELLYATREVEAYLVGAKGDARRAVEKLYQGEHGEDALRADLSALEACAGPGVPSVLAVEPERPRLLLALEPDAGTWLEAAIRDGPLPLASALALGVALAELLERIHATGHVCNGLGPWSLWLERETLRVQWFAAEFARPRGCAELAASARVGIPLLYYISPEQTGRMGRGVDARSDLYSLGATLFRALAGQPPFPASDSLAVVHAHLARLAPSLDEVAVGVPAVVARIVGRLLEKEPESRYPSAAQLRQDLEVCLEALHSVGEIPADLALRSTRMGGRPRFLTRMRGRERELQALQDAVDRARQGHFSTALIRGASGIGKSALVTALRGHAAEKGCGFVAASVESAHANRPHAALVRIFEGFVAQFAAESDLRLDARRRELAEALGMLAGVLHALVPELEYLLPAAPPPPPLGPAETLNRLSSAVQRFIAAVASPELPLVLAFDPLERLDGGTRRVLRDLITTPPTGHLLMIGVCDAETAGGEGAAGSTGEVSAHGHARLISEWTEAPHCALDVALGRLAESHCAAMLADALGEPAEVLAALAGVLARRSGGHPLMLQTLTQHVFDLELLRRGSDGRWTFDADAIAETPLPDGVAQLLSIQFARLGAELVSLLRVAACIGERFDAGLLARLMRLDDVGLRGQLERLAQQGILWAQGGGYAFSHPRARQAVLRQLRTSEGEAIHAEIARELASLPESERQQRVMELADHMSAAGGALSAEEAAARVHHDLAAGQRALDTLASEVAVTYLERARAGLAADAVEAAPGLRFDVLWSLARACFQAHQMPRALELLDELELQSLSQPQQLQVIEFRIQMMSLVEPGVVDIVEYVLGVLARFGLHIPSRPTWLATRLVLLRTDWVLRGSLGLDGFRVCAPATAMERFPAVFLLRSANTVLTARSARLSCRSTAYALRCFKRYGYLGTPALLLAGYAIYRREILARPSGIERYAEATLAWSQRVYIPNLTPRTRFLVAAFLHGWTRPRRSLVGPLGEMRSECLAVGDLQYAAYARAYSVGYALVTGSHLEGVIEQLRQVGESSGRLEARAFLHYATAGQMLRQGLADDARIQSLSDAIAELAGRRRSVGFTCWQVWLLVLCAFGCHAEAWRFSCRMLRFVGPEGSPTSLTVDAQFLRGLAAAGLLSTGARKRLRLRAALRSARRYVERWARGGSPDFVHMHDALRAEERRVARRWRASRALYQRAIERAESHGYGHHAALLLDRLADLERERGMGDQGAGARERAVQLYREWGATALAPGAEGRKVSRTPTSTTTPAR